MSFTKLVILIIVTYCLLLTFVFFYQRKLLYHPNFSNHVTGDGLIHSIEKINIKTEDNIDLKGWFHLKDLKKKTILFFHGNAGTLDNRIYKLNFLGNLDINFLIIAWRGYSGSSGKPTELGLYQDAKSAVNWLNLKGIVEKNIILYGESLGTSVAIEIGQNKNFAGIILEAPFTSMVDTGKKYYPFFPVKLLLKDKYESKNKIKNIKFPILVMHGKKDKIIPFYMGEAIYNLANKPKFKYFSDNDDHMMDFDENLVNEISSFLKSLN
jgi:hypothetical protein|tara:strand:- start:631 stop:1431 length:801 start_codon:yes stop_codon:yes gene_type:complete